MTQTTTEDHHLEGASEIQRLIISRWITRA
jgi:hypothetical protein